MKRILFLFWLIFLSFQVTGLSIESLDVSPSRIEPGGLATINMLIENEEDLDIENVLVKLDLSDLGLPIAPIGSGIEKFVLEIEDEENEYVYFDIMILPFAPLGVYKIPVVITYDKNEEALIKNEVISLEVYSNPIVEVVAINPDFLMGQSSNIEFKVINKGFSDVNFLSFKLKESSFYDFLSPNEAYMGTLDSDDFDTADFSLNINYPVPSEIPFTVILEYRDSSNQKHENSFIIYKKVYTFSEAKSLGLIPSDKSFGIYIPLIIFILFLLGYRRYKRKKKKYLM